MTRPGAGGDDPLLHGPPEGRLCQARGPRRRDPQLKCIQSLSVSYASPTSSLDLRRGLSHQLARYREEFILAGLMVAGFLLYQVGGREHAAWCMVGGAWWVVYGGWEGEQCLVHGAWCIVGGAWWVRGNLAHGAWCMVVVGGGLVHGAWCRWPSSGASCL